MAQQATGDERIPPSPLPPTIPSKAKRGLTPGVIADYTFTGALTFAALLVLASAVVMAGTLIIQAWPSLQRFGLGFLASSTWNPVTGHYGALIYIFGTLASSLLALLVAAPVSLAVAIYLTELAPPQARSIMSLLVELLAAIPSIVYGLWAIFVLTPLVRDLEVWLGAHLGLIPLFSGPPLGLGLLDAVLVLTVMIVPTITAISREVLRAVPPDQRAASLALGATQWETIYHVVLVYARAGIIGAIVLGLGRAVGETMAVTMVIGNGRNLSLSLFQTTDTLASVIANQFAEAADPLYTSSLLELGLLLFLLSVLLNAGARLLVWRTTRSLKGGS